MMIYNDVVKTFDLLTNRTYPHGTEHMIFDLLPQDLEMDSYGNLYKFVGNTETSVMFTSHLDTATKQITKVKKVLNDNYIKTDGNSILGADDKAGVSIMLYMMNNNVPGLYYFFIGEEVGCIGSRKLANEHKNERMSKISKVISFDRRGLDSIITFQFGKRTCSDEFAKDLSNKLNNIDKSFNYKADPTGICTDSVQFSEIYSECTNISVGYYNEHTTNEYQNISHLKKLANACIKINWEELKSYRDYSKIEYDDYDSYYMRPYKRDKSYSELKNKFDNLNTTSIKKPEKKYFKDYKFNTWSSVELLNKNISKINLCEKRISYEKKLIEIMMEDLLIPYSTIKWDGNDLYINYGDYETTTKRNKIEKVILEFNFYKELLTNSISSKCYT